MESSDIAILNCPKKHRFHSKCIGEWIESKVNTRFICPLCTTEFTEVIDIVPSKYEDNRDYLFTNNDWDKNTSKTERTPLNNQREGTTEIYRECDICCPCCIIS